jgi:hypothetical protein
MSRNLAAKRGYVTKPSDTHTNTYMHTYIQVGALRQMAAMLGNHLIHTCIHTYIQVGALRQMVAMLGNHLIHTYIHAYIHTGWSTAANGGYVRKSAA